MKKSNPVSIVRPANGARFNGDNQVELKQLLNALIAFKHGNFSVRLPADWTGLAGKVADTFNEVIAINERMSRELERIGREVGTEGKLGGQAKVKGVAGTWRDLTENVNLMAGNLTAQVRNIATVTTAVANGNLTKKITVDVKGEFLELKDTVNVMVDQLRS